MEPICETFTSSTNARWQTLLAGTGQLEATGSSLRFVTSGAGPEGYTNAQLDDYQGLPRRRFAWHPPLRLTVRARFSHTAQELRGTAGFGFWNDPMLMTQRRLPALPRAVWFFYSSAPSDMKLDIDTPGRGWKAASIDAMRSPALIWAPLAPLLVPLMRSTPLYRSIWPRIQRDLRIREAIMHVDMRRWNTYVLHWGKNGSRFTVMGEDADTSTTLLLAPSPQGPLGLVIWQDNQYLAVAPWGHIRWGLLGVPKHQWMEIDHLEVAPWEEH